MREFIVEADGGSRGNPGPAGYGSVVLDASTGETLVEAAEYIGIATNNVAEYRGLLAGLRAARELDPGASVRVRMDSKLVVEQMSGRWKIKHPDMKPLAASAAGVLPSSQVTYEWIPRERNKHADRLANEAMDAGRRGEQWSASASTAELDARGATDAATADVRAARSVAGSTAGARAAGVRAADVRAAKGGARAPEAAAPEAEAPEAEPSEGEAPAVGWGASAELGPPATFVLLRHGETPLTPSKRFSGSGGSDPALSATGRDQAEHAAHALAARGTIQAVVSSPLARCRETAGIIAARLGLPTAVEDDLRETDFGAWEGLSFGEVRERHREDLDAWLASTDVAPTGGGESFAEVAVRVTVARDRLLAVYAGRTVLLVSHVTPIKTLVQLALGAPLESLFRMELSAASFSVIAYYADGNASLTLLNDTGHLHQPLPVV